MNVKRKEVNRMKLAVQIDDDENLLEEFGISSPDYDALEEVWREYLEEKDPNLATSEMVTVSLKICSVPAMKDLNLRYRFLDEPTDVLSFPMWEQSGLFSPPSEWSEIPLGDIVICPEVVKLSSDNESRDATLDFLLVLMHGFLHLLAWDHDTAEKESVMFSEQESLLKRYLQKV
jgi:probable rRNA maturation factor